MRRNKARGKEGKMVLGIAGGVGSGKSTVLEILQNRYQAYLCMADGLGHEAMRKGTGVHQKIVDEFGSAVLAEDGEIERNVLAGIVYREEERLNILNAIIHPFVIQEIQRRMDECPGNRLFVLESAILFETGCDALCDVVWGVITETEIRIQRLMASRGYTRERAESIMTKQMGNAELAERCDGIVVNDGDRGELEQRISELFGKMGWQSHINCDTIRE